MAALKRSVHDSLLWTGSELPLGAAYASCAIGSKSRKRNWLRGRAFTGRTSEESNGGERNPALVKFGRLAKALQVSLAEFWWVFDGVPASRKRRPAGRSSSV